MGELNENQKGNPQQDAGLTSQATKEATSQETPETLTREEYQKLLSNEKAKMGRELKAAKAEAEQFKTAHTKLESELTETRERMSDIQKRIDEAEEEEAKGSPDSLRLYKRQKELRELESKLKDEKRQVEKERQENIAELTAAKEGKTEMAIVAAAVEHHVDIGKLKEEIQEIGLTNPSEAQVSRIAQILAGQSNADGNGKKKIPQGDSGATIGGKGSIEGLSRKALYEKAYSDK